MQRILLAIALVLTLGVVANAGCPNGQCRRPVRNAVAAVPTLARPAAPHAVPSVGKRTAERSVVVRRSHVRGPGLFARLSFRPQRWR